MGIRRIVGFGSGLLFLSVSGLILSRADDTLPDTKQLPVPHGECTAFGGNRERMVQYVLRAAGAGSHDLSRNTTQVLQARSAGPMRNRATSFDQATQQLGLIDSYLFADMQANGVQPAGMTTDWEFIRRVTLDLTGRIPTPARVLSFVADTASDKRAKLVEELLASPQWVDKWTMYLGDLYQNTDNRPSTSLRRFPQGRNAFYSWIHDSLAGGKPYNQMATEIITATGNNSYSKGELNWILNGYITGGPQQDITDSMAANVSTVFLGISHMNCLLCHNGRGHLDQLSLWGAQTTRYQAWNFASYLSRTTFSRVNYDPNNRNNYYWSVQDNVNHDYQLGTTTGNRPARNPTAPCPAGKTCYVPPIYIFNGATVNPGENYRVALARLITSDIQFARATVNYMWAQFFGRGIVDPPDQFDPARLDPDNPPPDPWTLQPSNPRLLNALAQRFVDSGYDLKGLMRDITNSNAYQLASEYNGQWDVSWEPLFARKFVRRLWGEEIHDAVIQSSGVMPSYKVTGFSDQGFGNVTFVMQLPDTVNQPGGTMTTLLDNFMRGNRDDQPRRTDGSILQALSLMNDNFIMTRIDPGGANANQILAQNLSKPNDQLVNALFLGVLSRYPNDAEMQTALAAIQGAGSKASGATNLLWSLYNKADFVFNY
jgi:hypothetical protein